jgi:hypothetical protein
MCYLNRSLGITSLFYRDYFKNRYEYENDMSNFMRDDILEPAKRFLDNQINLGKKFFSDFKKCEKDWQSSLTAMEKVIS